MKHIKIAVLSCAILALTGLILYNIPFPKYIDTTLSGVECRIGEEGYADTEIHIKGTYYSYLFKKDIFTGFITVNGYDYTFDETMRMDNITIADWAMLGYYKTSPLQQKSLGRIFTTNNFKEILITPYDIDPQNTNRGHWDSEGGRFICFPASTKAEAVKIGENFWEDIVWD